MHKSRCLFAWLLAGALVLFAFPINSYSGNPVHSDHSSWATEHLFEHRVLIENKGQFDGKDLLHSTPILYGARCGGVDLYFNQQGLCFRKDEYKKLDEEEREKIERHPESKKSQALTKPVVQLLEAEWVGSNPLATITAENLQTTSFHYPAAGNKTLIAAAYKKIIYHDLYPHIDVEYILPDNKEGIKYSLIVHPGADLSKVSLQYSGDMSLTPSGDLSVKSDFGDLCDHAPVAWYAANHQAIKSGFLLKNGALTFQFPNGYDATRTLIIDPWTTDPAFASYDAAYDLESDNNGNIYVYGSFSPFQLEKFGPAGGAPLWVYTASILSGTYYGDLATDETSGTTYLVEGWNSGFSGAQVIKVNTNGIQTGLFPGNSTLNEMWRADYDACDKMIVIGCGGTSGQQQTAILDTNMVNVTPANSINTTDNGYHDISLLTIDPAGGSCYMATTQSLLYAANFNNVMFKVPLPALVPATFLVADLNDLQEFTQLNYVSGTGVAEGYNGFNGMACSLNFLYTYNGDTIRKWNKNTGAFIASTTTGGTMYETGGLAVDVCDHIYAGAGTVIKEFDVNLNPIGSFPVTNTVYDVKLGANNKLLACGIQFVQQIDLAALAPLQLTTSATPSGCSCSGTATATTTLCGNPTAVIYSWSPGGQTTATATGLCPGTYTVSVTPSCVLAAVTGTVVITGAAGTLILTTTETNVTCHGANDGTATVTANGTAPYTYNWAPTGGTAATATGLAPGTYTVSVSDAGGCTVTATTTITQPTAVTAASTPATICMGQCTNLTATGGGGTPGYTYSWTQNGTPLASTNVCPTATTIYTVTVTDNTNCVSPPTTVKVTVNPVLEIVTAPGKSLCPGLADTLNSVATGGSGVYTYLWMPAAGLSSTTIANPIATPVVTTTYTIILSDNCGTTTDSAMVTVTVVAGPVLTFSADDTAGCAPLCVNFTAVSNPACASATWNFGDGTTGTGCSGLHHCYPAPGSYSISESITDINGCKGSLSKNNYINVWPFPVAAYTTSPQPTTILQPVITFTDHSTGGVTSWAWSFGDVAAGSSTLQNPQYTYPDTGCYPTMLIVTNTFGCVDTAKHPICIQPDFTFYAPNTFTPNGDGINDLWTPSGIGIDPNHFNLMIFDRWGNQIWSTATWGEGWDGKANGGGQVAQIDTYVWKCALTDVLGNKHEYTGHCSLIR